MDSRPHDDFIQPERTTIDEASPASETTATGELAFSPAPVEATEPDDLDIVIDDLELELADLLTPDLEAMDLEEPVADTPTVEFSETPAGHMGGEPIAAQSDASGQPPVDPVIASDPAPSSAIVATTGSDPLAADGDALLDADELELTLDEMTADMLAPEPQAMVEDVPVSGEPAVLLAETVVAPQVVAVAEPMDIEMAVGDAQATAEPDMPPVIEASAESSGQAPVVETAELPAAEPETPVEHARAEAVASETEAIMVPPPAPVAGGDAPETGASVTFEQALDAQDLSAVGFEAAVRGAADRSRSRFLFQMPVHTVADCQRVAAVNLPGDEAPRTVLVLLRADGRSYRMEDARESDNPFAGMAVSYGGLLAHLKSLPTRAAA